MLIKIHNIETGKTIEREMNEAELAIYVENEMAQQKEKAERKEKEIIKLALLEKLGISKEEAQLLLG